MIRLLQANHAHYALAEILTAAYCEAYKFSTFSMANQSTGAQKNVTYTNDLHEWGYPYNFDIFLGLSPVLFFPFSTDPRRRPRPCRSFHLFYCRSCPLSRFSSLSRQQGLSCTLDSRGFDYTWIGDFQTAKAFWSNWSRSSSSSHRSILLGSSEFWPGITCPRKFNLSFCARRSPWRTFCWTIFFFFPFTYWHHMSFLRPHRSRNSKSLL